MDRIGNSLENPAIGLEAVRKPCHSSGVQVQLLACLQWSPDRIGNCWESQVFRYN
jgi:hypothetical protein